MSSSHVLEHDGLLEGEGEEEGEEGGEEGGSGEGGKEESPEASWRPIPDDAQFPKNGSGRLFFADWPQQQKQVQRHGLTCDLIDYNTTSFFQHVYTYYLSVIFSIIFSTYMHKI